MRERTRNLIAAALLLLFMAPVVYFNFTAFRAGGVFANDPPGAVWLSVLFIVLGGLANFYLALLLHELGHLLFGLCAKFFLYSFRIGPLCLTRSGAGTKLSFSLHNHYGTCVMVPKTADGFYRHTFVKVLGGPVASLLMAVASWLVLYLATSLPLAWYAALGAGATVNTYVFLRELLPYASATTENDGAQLLGILKRTPRMQMNLKLFAIQCLIMRGDRPKDIDARMFFDVPVLADNCQERLLMENYRYLRYLDAGDTEQALACSDFIEGYAPELNEVYRPSVYSDIFFNYAFLRRDEARAAELYLKIEKYLKMDRNVVNLRMRMAHELYVEGLPKRALRTAKDALEIKDSFVMRGVVPLEERLIAEMSAEAERLRDSEERELPDNTLTPFRG